MHATPLSASPEPAAPDGVFRHPLRVYWEDTDAGGVVFCADDLKFFERARTTWLRALGFAQQQLRRQDGVICVVADTAPRCRRAERLDDLLEVTATLADAGRASTRLAQQAWRDAELLAEGEIRMGCVAAHKAMSTGFRPCRIPAAILEKIQ